LARLGGKSPAPGHARPVNQDRDDPDVACQGCLDFQPDEVAWVLQAPPPVLAGDRQPAVTDQRQQHITARDRGGDHLDKVIAQRDRVHVLEDLAPAEPLGQPVIQPPGRIGSLFTPVTDKNAASRWCGRCRHDPPPLIPSQLVTIAPPERVWCRP